MSDIVLSNLFIETTKVILPSILAIAAIRYNYKIAEKNSESNLKNTKIILLHQKKVEKLSNYWGKILKLEDLVVNILTILSNPKYIVSSMAYNKLELEKHCKYFNDKDANIKYAPKGEHLFTFMHEAQKLLYELGNDLQSMVLYFDKPGNFEYIKKSLYTLSYVIDIDFNGVLEKYQDELRKLMDINESDKVLEIDVYSLEDRIQNIVELYLCKNSLIKYFQETIKGKVLRTIQDEMSVVSP